MSSYAVKTFKVKKAKNVEVELATWEMLKPPPPVEGEAAAEGNEP